MIRARRPSIPGIDQSCPSIDQRTASVDRCTGCVDFLIGNRDLMHRPRVTDYDRSKQFYEAALAPLGYRSE
jgi:hypothetical protein